MSKRSHSPVTFIAMLIRHEQNRTIAAAAASNSKNQLLMRYSFSSSISSVTRIVDCETRINLQRKVNCLLTLWFASNAMRARLVDEKSKSIRPLFVNPTFYF
jgi:hypothetical protein